MRTHDLPTGHYWGVTELNRFAPRKHTAPVYEVDPPYRYSTARVYKFGRLGVVVGRWTGRAANETEHLMQAIRGREYRG